MSSTLHLYNTKSKQLEAFEPINAPFVGIYLCGPTVYGHPHLGHSRGAITVDVLVRFLKHQDFKVRYVRNITDVGHLLGDADEGEDKIGKLAQAQQLEPMEVAHMYTDSYEHCLRLLNTNPPSIAPRATGHIQEQVKMIEEIIANGFAYEVNNSVYFDIEQYAKDHDYGSLSGRILEDLIAGAGEERRELAGQSEKRNPADFALWKKAEPMHLMKWDSPWGVGFPGWHIECSAMSTKYLGDFFDIHAGGLDLLFPHHECEIAQCQASRQTGQAKYWIHNNMITMNGQKMSKRLNNGILLHELFEGSHHLLNQAYTPMTLRFFILQAHYRSTLDFSNDALKAAEKGLNRLLETARNLDNLTAGHNSNWAVGEWKVNLYQTLNDDLNTPQCIALLFEGVKMANKMMEGEIVLDKGDLSEFKSTLNTFIFEILGLKDEQQSNQSNKVDGLMNLLLDIRTNAKNNKDYTTSDLIRNQLSEIGIEVKDGKDGSSYSIVE